jgi:hypothetical protein
MPKRELRHSAPFQQAKRRGMMIESDYVQSNKIDFGRATF